MNSATKSSSRLLLTACIISFASFFASYMRIPIVPLFAASLGADTVQVGMINGSFMLTAGVLSIPSGLLSDRLGRRLPLLGGMILLSVSSLMLYWSNSPLQMAAIYLLFGMGLSAFSPSLMSYVADFTPPDMLGQAFGWYTMALYGGMTLGPAAGGFLGTVLGLRSVFLIASGLIFTMFLVAFAFLPAQSVGHSRGVVSPAILSSLMKLMKNRKLIACLVATLGGCMGFGMFITFMPLYMRSLEMDTGQVGFVFAAQAVANGLSRLPTGKLCDRIADKSILVSCGLAVFAFSLACFGICDSVLSLMATAAVMGISLGIAFTVICTLIVDIVPMDFRGLAMGCYNTSAYFGMMLSSIGLGAIIREEGFKVCFFLIGAVAVTAMFLFRILYYRHKGTGEKYENDDPVSFGN